MPPTFPQVTPWQPPFRLIQHPYHLQAVPELLTTPLWELSTPPSPKQTWSTTPSLPSKAVCSPGLFPLPRGLAPAWLVQGVFFSSTPILHPRGPSISASAPRHRGPDHRGLETSAHSSFTQERCPAPPLPHQSPKGDGRKVGRWGDAQLPSGADPSVGTGARMFRAYVREAAGRGESVGARDRQPGALGGSLPVLFLPRRGT